MAGSRQPPARPHRRRRARPRRAQSPLPAPHGGQRGPVPPTAAAALPRRGCPASGAAAASPFPAGRGAATTPRRRRLLLPAPGMEGRGGPGPASPGAAPQPSPPGPPPTPGRPLTRGGGREPCPAWGARMTDMMASQSSFGARSRGAQWQRGGAAPGGAVGICSPTEGRCCGLRGGRLRVPAGSAAQGQDPAGEGGRRAFAAGCAHGIPVVLFGGVLGRFCRLRSADGWRQPGVKQPP